MNIVHETSPSLDGINVTCREGLISLGFTGLGQWGRILEGGLPDDPILGHRGVYAVLTSQRCGPRFHSLKEARHNRNVIKPSIPERLNMRWVEDASVLYFGAAGVRSHRTLRERLNQMRNHCLGKTTDRGPHKGGEILWQVRGHQSFEVLALPTGEAPITRVWERSLITRFKQLTGRLPFANKHC